MICTAAYDFRSDQRRDADAEVPTAAVLIFDGVFLLRPELAGQWDLAIYLRVSPGMILRRTVARDLDLLGSPEEIRRRYLGRYLPGQALYCAEAVPEDTAHVVIGNDNASNPVIIRWHPPGSAAHEGPGREERTDRTGHPVSEISSRHAAPALLLAGARQDPVCDATRTRHVRRTGRQVTVRTGISAQLWRLWAVNPAGQRDKPASSR